MATASLIIYVDSNVNQGGESSKNLTLPLLEIHALRLLYYKKRVEAAEIVSFLVNLIDKWYLKELDQYSMLSIDC